MATYVNDLRLKEITPGDEDGTWGTSTNTNWDIVAEAWGTGTLQFAADANETFTMADGTTSEVRSAYITVTSAGTLTATRTLTLAPSTLNKVWFIKNSTTGGQSITIKQGSGDTVTIANGDVKFISTDGAGAGASVTERTVVSGLGTMSTQNANAVAITGGTITGITDLAVADGGTGASTAADARTNLGLGTIATQAASAVSITGGSITGITDLAVADGGTGASTASGARTNLGATTVGDSFFTLTNPGAITFPRMNANNTVTALSAADFRTATGSGTVTSVTGTGSASGLTLSGTVTSSGNITLSGAVAVDNGSWSGTALAVTNGGTGATSASAARTNLELGTVATQNANNVAITGGSITGATVGLTSAAATISTGTLTLDLSIASLFTVSVGANFVVALSNVPSGRPVPFTVVFTNTGTYDFTSGAVSGYTVKYWDGQTINLKPNGTTVLSCCVVSTTLLVWCYWMDNL